MPGRRRPSAHPAGLALARSCATARVRPACVVSWRSGLLVAAGGHERSPVPAVGPWSPMLSRPRVFTLCGMI